MNTEKLYPLDVATGDNQAFVQQGDVLKLAPTREDVEDLKLSWERDSWDFALEDTEGFEAHREELKSFRLERELLDAERRERQKAAERQEASKRCGIPADHPAIDYIITLENRLKRFEARLGEVEERIDWSRS